MSILLLLIVSIFSSRLLECKQLIRDRSVRCRPNQMDVFLAFEESFNGVVFAEKAYNSSRCRWFGNSTSFMNISVPIQVSNAQNSCGITIDEKIGEMSVSLTITPMKGILVDGTTTLGVRCLYLVDDITVTLGSFDIIAVDSKTGVVSGTAGTPSLEIRILDGHGVTGAVVQQASVGQRLTLDVVLKETAIYDFTLHSCLAHDGSNSPDATLQIIDANGCAVSLPRAIDPPVLTLAPTAGGPKHVFIYIYGFQFTSSQFVHFECQVRPCVLNCRHPQCDRRAPTKVSTDHSARRLRKVADDSYDNDVTRLHLRTVLRMKAQAFEASELSSESSHPGRGVQCMSMAGMISTGVTVMICLPLIVTLAIILLFMFRHRERSSNWKWNVSNCQDETSSVRDYSDMIINRCRDRETNNY